MSEELTSRCSPGRRSPGNCFWPGVHTKEDGRRSSEADAGLALRRGHDGLSGPVLHNRPVAEPQNLGPGWAGFNFSSAFKYPIRIVNDAAMQALGGYRRGKMLFLGLGTGLGSALIVDGIVEPMELGHLPYKKATFEDYVGLRGLERFGKKKWRRYVADVVQRLIAAIEPDDVVLGGGNVHKLKELPPKCRAGDNANAFEAGFDFGKTRTHGTADSQSIRLESARK